MKRQFMRKQVINRVTALVLACLLAFPTPYPVSAAETEHKISSAEELMDFAQKCSLDTWSQGKTFRLTKDIDLTGSAFTPIPTFGGTFLGNGHSITGLYLTDNGSKQGLFRNIQSGGTVSDLKVEGTVQPGGSHTNIGGIAGSNSGTIQNCNFKGSVKGETAVGGIAGVNQETGQINGSSVSGTVQGQNGIGGIAGKNLGILMKCENSANVNTSEDAANLNVDTAEMLTQQTRATTVETMLEGHTDVGGVAGYSSGVVQSCTNLGEVGYQHIGYNVGGIVGRQTGYLASCMNSGNVMGRKDVGGIAGQAEPYIAMLPGEDRLAGLREELNTLDTLISKALDDAGAANDEVSVHLTNMGKITDNARDSSKMLADSGADFVNDNIEAINSISVTLVNALDSMTPAVEEMKNAAHWLNAMIGKLEEGLNELQIAPENAAILHAAVQEMNAAYNELVNVSGELDTAVKNLVSALTRNDSTSADAALKEIGTVLSKLGGFYRKVGDAIGKITDALKPVTPGVPDSSVDGNVPENPVADKPLNPIHINLEAAAKWRDGFYQIADALEQAGAGWPGALEDWGKVQAALSAVAAAFEKGVSASQNIGSAAGTFLSTLSSSVDVESAKAQLTGAMEDAGSMSRSLEQVFKIFADVTRQLSKDGPVEFASINEEARTASENLYASLGNLSKEMQSLNSTMQNNGDVLTEDIRAISHQFNVVFNVLLDSVASLQDGDGKKAEDYIQDTSDEDIAATRLGKVTDCRSTGTVEGDRNVGGILGAMAIEYDLDPEDDIERFSIANTYEIKVVLENCVNNGKVTGKKDCVGGLVGRMDLGTAVGGQNYGAVESTAGNYVGGAVGWSDGFIRRCYAKSTLSGGNYVGGIAGWADKLTDSSAIVTVLDGTECVGAVAGDADLTEGVIRNNCFVDTGTAAIDGISYSEKAVPVAFEDLRKQAGIPVEFVSFTLTLLADGEIVAKIPFLYGNDLSLIELPEVPNKEGEYGKWPEFDTSGLKSDITLEAVYTPWITVVNSVEKDDKLSLGLAEGSFTEETTLHITDSEGNPPVENVSALWNVELSGTKLTEKDETPLRLLNKVGRKAEVWQVVDGKWKQMDATRSGQYLLLTMTGTSGTFCISEGTDSSMALIWTAVLLIVLLFAVLMLIRRFRKKRVSAKEKKADKPIKK